MSSRDRLLTILLACFLGLSVLGMAGYFLVYGPLQEKADAAMKLREEISDKETRLVQITKNRPRLEASIKRSLPADSENARHEYSAILAKLMRDARIPISSYSIKPKLVDSKSAPELSPTIKRPAFTRHAFEVTLKRVDYATLLDVLYRYYQLNLLHQITRFNLKRQDDASTARRNSTNADKSDLDVMFVTEAISLDGAETRRSLLPVPMGMAAAGGGGGYAAVQHSPVVARGLQPLQFAQVMATDDRDYTKLLVADVFHGPPPPPAPPPPTPPETPKEDTSPFIRLTGVGRNPDGTGTAYIEDTASKNEYVIELDRKDGKLVPVVSKYYYTAKGQKKSMEEPNPRLEISEASSGTSRSFRVVGLDGYDLVLVAREFAPTSAFAKKPKTSRTPPASAVAGYAAVAAPPEKVFLWKHGETLSMVKELSRTDSLRAIQRATASDTSTAADTSKTSSASDSVINTPTKPDLE